MSTQKITEALSCKSLFINSLCKSISYKRDETDIHYMSKTGILGYEFKDESKIPEWSEKYLNAESHITLLSEDSAGKFSEEVIASSSSITGIAISKTGEEAVYAWTEGDRNKSFLKSYMGGEIKTVIEADTLISNPQIIIQNDKPLFGYEVREKDNDKLIFVESDGSEAFSIAGKNARIEEIDSSTTALVLESNISTEGCDCQLILIKEGKVSSTENLPSKYDMNLHPDLCYDEKTGLLHIVCESTTLWGFNELLGNSRDIMYYTCDIKNNGKPVYGPSTSNGIVFIEKDAIFDKFSSFNLPPIQPRVILINGKTTILYKRFHHAGDKGFGWDIIMSTVEENSLSNPVMLNENITLPDTDYSVIERNKKLLCLIPSCNHKAAVTFEEMESGGAKERRQPSTANTFRLEIYEKELNNLPAPPAVHKKYRGVYALPMSVRDIGAAPELTEKDGYKLVWGDMHVHSTYSKCMSTADGTPEEVFRYQKDIMKNDVIFTTDHVPYYTGVEADHVFDVLDFEAGKSFMPVYGVEYSGNPAHHTNIYAIDRDIFARLRLILLQKHTLMDAYEAIKKELPKESVTAIRHMHGFNKIEFGTNSERCCDTHDSEMEWAMEAMQTRGSMMMPRVWNPQFPANFLNAGAKLGVVGGSDHSRGLGQNHFCLTGFWVKEFTAEAVFKALRERRTIACANGKLSIWAELDGSIMGNESKVSGEVNIKSHLSCPQEIKKACLIRDGEFLDWVEVNTKDTTIALTDPNPPKGNHWYMVTAEADSVFQNPGILGHASPIFVEVS
ncbi:MAG: CehA/McbA family metallohydrolase domain-containing protein [Planctomycetota bacterium]